MSHPNNKVSSSSVDNQEIELIVGNSSSNFSGVTSTMLQVTSLQKCVDARLVMVSGEFFMRVALTR